MWAYGKRLGHPRGLRIWVLEILGRGPRSGAEIIQDMDAMTHGWWRPSPGSVYPLLEALVAEELARKRPDGRYELSKPLPMAAAWSWGQRAPMPRTPTEVIGELEGLVPDLEDRLRKDPARSRELRERLGKLAQRIRTLAS
jgi:hypothetical protein